MITMALTIFSLASGQHAAERIQQAQYCAAVERYDRRREIKQAVSRFEPELAAEQHRREVAKIEAPHE